MNSMSLFSAILGRREWRNAFVVAVVVSASVIGTVSLTGCGKSEPKVMMPETPAPPPKPGSLKQHSSTVEPVVESAGPPQQQQ
jgi:hypothetical protein